MMKKILTLILSCFALSAFSQGPDTKFVQFFPNGDYAGIAAYLDTTYTMGVVVQCYGSPDFVDCVVFTMNGTDRVEMIQKGPISYGTSYWLPADIVAPEFESDPVFADSLSAINARIAAKQTALGFTPYNATNPSNFINQAGARTAISLTTTGSGAASYNNSTGVLNVPTPAGYVPSINVSSRSINSSTYTISASNQATVYYTVKIACTATIGSASSGRVQLQYSINAGSSWVDVAEVENSNTVTLAIVLNSTTVQSTVLTGVIPANALVRLVPTTAGTTTVTMIRQNEVY